MHLAAKQQRWDGSRVFTQLPRHGLIPAGVFRMTGEFQSMQFYPRARPGYCLDVGMRLGAVRAGERPKKIKLHFRLAVCTGFEPSIVGLTGIGKQCEQAGGYEKQKFTDHREFSVAEAVYLDDWRKEKETSRAAFSEIVTVRW
jgi:hypothetical protein